MNDLEPLKAQVASLKQNAHNLKESNLKIHDLTGELEQVKAKYEKLKSENDEKTKLKSQLEKDLKETNNKTDSEIESLRTQLTESQDACKKFELRTDELKAMLGEIETERANHQKLIKEFGKLEQRFEKVNSDLLKHTKRSKQDPIELESLMEEIDGQENPSIKSTDTLTDGVANFEKNKLLYMTANGSEMDLGLLSKLQKRIMILESEKKDLLKSGYSKIMIKNDNNNNDTKDFVSTQNMTIERLIYFFKVVKLRRKLDSRQM